jgi:hypothetical protein
MPDLSAGAGARGGGGQPARAAPLLMNLAHVWMLDDEHNPVPVSLDNDFTRDLWYAWEREPRNWRAGRTRIWHDNNPRRGLLATVSTVFLRFGHYSDDLWETMVTLDVPKHGLRDKEWFLRAQTFQEARENHRLMVALARRFTHAPARVARERALLRNRGAWPKKARQA